MNVFSLWLHTSASKDQISDCMAHLGAPPVRLATATDGVRVFSLQRAFSDGQKDDFEDSTTEGVQTVAIVEASYQSKLDTRLLGVVSPTLTLTNEVIAQLEEALSAADTSRATFSLFGLLNDPSASQQGIQPRSVRLHTGEMFVFAQGDDVDELRESAERFSGEPDGVTLRANDLRATVLNDGNVIFSESATLDEISTAMRSIAQFARSSPATGASTAQIPKVSAQPAKVTSPSKTLEPLIHVLWINAGLSCDGDSVALTAATQPSIEEILLGALPGLPNVAFHWPLLDFECGPSGGADDFLEWFFKADRGELESFVLVIEGSIPNERLHDEGGYWAAFGNNPATGQPITTSEWLDRLAPKATAVVAVGTCATYGGIHAMAGNPTGAIGVPDYLGWDWVSKAGVPIVCVPGCPIQPDNLSETLTYLLYMLTGQAPMIPLDDALRPKWLFGNTVHEGCDRAGYYEQGEFASEYGSPKCIVKLGCWGPVVKCNVAKRGWINGIGGCPNVGGICIGCTMPGFPDKFMPFMDEPPGGKVSTVASGLYGSVIRSLRQITARKLDKEPVWRRPGANLETGATRTW